MQLENSECSAENECLDNYMKFTIYPQLKIKYDCPFIRTIFYLLMLNKMVIIEIFLSIYNP